jgi:hypothetical protein
MESRRERIAAELRTMAAEDLKVRGELAATGELFDGYHPMMRAVHERNADRLLALVQEIGWPTKIEVGEEASEAAWLIAQHAISRPEVQRRCAALLEAAAQRSEVPAWQAAMLADRIRVYEGHPQLYGTQFDWTEDGRMEPRPIEDPDNVDARRAAIGLAPLATRQEEVLAAALREGQRPPSDLVAHRAAFEEWLAGVGWRTLDDSHGP